jgi:hypothetical protein
MPKINSNQNGIAEEESIDPIPLVEIGGYPLSLETRPWIRKGLYQVKSHPPSN